MNLLVLSDLHLEFADFSFRGAPAHDVVVLAGDINAPGRKVPAWPRHPRRAPKKPIVFVAGNHEYYGTSIESERKVMRERAVSWNVHFLDCDEAVINGVRFLGATLWSDFRLPIDSPSGLHSDRDYAMALAREQLSDFDVIQTEGRLFSPEDAALQHDETCNWLAQRLKQPFNGKTVVVTHHAPHRGSVSPKFADDWLSAAFSSDLPSSFFDVPALWVHGHTHQSFDYRVGNSRILCNARGYPLATSESFENPAFNPRLVVEV